MTCWNLLPFSTTDPGGSGAFLSHIKRWLEWWAPSGSDCAPPNPAPTLQPGRSSFNQALGQCHPPEGPQSEDGSSRVPSRDREHKVTLVMPPLS
jgi:hypothetical protein